MTKNPAAMNPDPPAQTNATGASPRSAAAIEAWLIEKIVAALETPVQQIDPQAPFTNFNMESIAVFTLTGELAAWLGHDLAATLLWDYPTIHSLSQHLAGQETQQVREPVDGVLFLQNSGTGPVLFCMPGLGGHPRKFDELARLMGAQQVVCGLLYPGMDGQSQALKDIGQIAQKLLPRIRQVQPEGPYHLVGHSFGGTIAFEVARLLVADGQRVGLLTMLDTTVDRPRLRPLHQRLLLHFQQLRQTPLKHHIPYISARVRRLWGRFGLVGGEVETPDNPRVDGYRSQLEAARRQSRKAWEHYAPQQFAGRILLCKATDFSHAEQFLVNDPHNGWAELATEGVDVREVPVPHRLMLKSPHVDQVASVLRQYMPPQSESPKRT